MVFISNYYYLDEYNEMRENFEEHTNEPSTIILLHNEKDYHYEIIESIMIYIEQIVGQRIQSPIFYLDLEGNDPSFKDYLSSKYDNLKWDKPSFYHYYVELSFYKDQISKYRNDSMHFYIGHEISPELEIHSNIYFITPLSKNYISCHYLPFYKEKYNSNIPIYIVQGNLDETRRDFSLLVKLLSQSYPFDFRIKLIGRGDMPASLQPFSDKIIVKNNLNFQEFHTEFLDGYCLLPLVSKENNPSYYKNKLTSSVNYILGYQLKCIVDYDLQNIYHFDNAYIYHSPADIQNVFLMSLINFYKK
jgi:hypothetical protein